MVSRRGSSMLGCLVWVVLIGIVGYVGAHVGEPYYRYYRFRDAVSQRVRFASVHKDAAIQSDIWAAADSLGLPEQAYHVQITRDSDTIRVTDSYEDSWTVLNYTRPVQFTLKFEGSL